jgi:hypothetical protein
MDGEVAPHLQFSSRRGGPVQEPVVEQPHIAATLFSGRRDVAAASSDAAARLAARVRDGVHFVPNDGRRFPICGSWRSNWNHTGDSDRATCPECRERLASRSPPGSGGAEET